MFRLVMPADFNNLWLSFHIKTFNYRNYLVKFFSSSFLRGDFHSEKSLLMPWTFFFLNSIPFINSCLSILSSIHKNSFYRDFFSWVSTTFSNFFFIHNLQFLSWTDKWKSRDDDRAIDVPWDVLTLSKTRDLREEMTRLRLDHWRSFCCFISW